MMKLFVNNTKSFTLTNYEIIEKIEIMTIFANNTIFVFGFQIYISYLNHYIFVYSNWLSFPLIIIAESKAQGK